MKFVLTDRFVDIEVEQPMAFSEVDTPLLNEIRTAFHKKNLSASVTDSYLHEVQPSLKHATLLSNRPHHRTIFSIPTVHNHFMLWNAFWL
jgi:hypothetical protein